MKRKLGFVLLALLIVFLLYQHYQLKAETYKRWALVDDRLNEIVSVPVNPNAEYMLWSRQCTPTGTPDTATLRMYARLKGGVDTFMGKDDAGYEFQIGGANIFLTQGENISTGGGTSDPLEIGEGTWFWLTGGGVRDGGFTTLTSNNIDEKGRIIILVADRNTILVDSGDASTNLDLGGCNLNMAAGRPHMFFFDGCKWHLIGHHNDF